MPKPFRFMRLEAAVDEPSELLVAIDAATSEGPVRVATVNPEMALLAGQRDDFRQAVRRMTDCCIDGTGLVIWSTLAGSLPPKRYHGADLVNDLFARYRDGSRSFYLLGGEEGHADAARAEIERRFPGVRIVGAESGGRIADQDVRIEAELAGRIRKAKPHILLVGFGAPKQELWIDAARDTLEVPVMIGVGGTIDFYVAKRRSPRWVSRLGLEWLYRGLTEPGHWRRVWRAVVVFSAQALAWTLSPSRLFGKSRR